MKRMIALLLMTAVLTAAAVTAVSADTTTPTYICGDSDGDGDVTIFDVTKIQKLLADLITDDDGMITLRGDVNSNGLDIIDASMIQRYLADLNVNAPIGSIIGSTEVQTEVQTQPQTQKPTRDPYELPYAPSY